MSAATVGRVWLIGVIALLATACQGDAEAPAPAQATTVPVPTAAAVTATPLPPTRAPAPGPTATPSPAPATDVGWTTHQAPDFSVSLPEGWQVHAVDEANAAALFESLQRTDPHLAGIVSGPDAIRSSVLLAFASPAGSGFTDNANIRRIPLRGQAVTDLPGLTAALSTELQRLGFAVRSSDTDLSLAGSPAARLISAIATRNTAGEAVELRCHQYLVVTRDDLWILAYTTVAGREETMRTVFERSAATFGLK